MKAIIMMTYARLHNIEDLLPFYTHIFHGRPPSGEVLSAGRERFASIGTADPLSAVTARQARAVQQRLDALQPKGEPVKVYVAAKHTAPYVDDVVKQLAEDGASTVYSFPLSPLYSRTGTAAYHLSVRKALAAIGADMPVYEVDRWHLHPGLTEAVSSRLLAALQWLPKAKQAKSLVLFTAHSQPGTAQSNAQFIRSFSEMARAVAAGANCTRWQLAYRSAGPAPQKWLTPDLSEVMRQVADQDIQAVVVCDLLSMTANVEAIFDCRIDALALARHLGLDFVASEFLDDSADYIDVLTDVLAERIGAAKEQSGAAPASPQQPSLLQSN